MRYLRWYRRKPPRFTIATYKAVNRSATGVALSLCTAPVHDVSACYLRTLAVHAVERLWHSEVLRYSTCQGNCMWPRQFR